MKEEIEKILKDCRETDYALGSDGDEIGFTSFNETDASAQLQKLFLSKQIELLEGIITGNGWVATCNKLKDTITKLQSELKQLP